MGTTLPHSIIYETADARSVGHEMPSLEMLMHMSFFSVPRLLRPCSAMRQPGKRKPTNLVGLPRKPNGWIVRTSSSSTRCRRLPATYPLIKTRAYSHQGHGPRADQTGRIHIAASAIHARSHFRNAAGPYIWVTS